MMRSMFSGVSSLKSHQLKMDVIGNNIANVNTVGYKASSVSFSEMYSQTLKGASSSTTSRGGTNPMQVGLGANVASVAVNHTKGSIQRTDVATDIMIDGEGFFMVTNDATAQNKFYTRAGNFQMDEQGYLVTSDGLRVLDNEFKPIQVNMSDSKNASMSTNILINGNISTTEAGYNTTVDVYDSLGDVHTLKIDFPGLPIPTTGAITLGTNPSTNDPANDPLNVVNGVVTAAPHNYTYRKMTITDSTGKQIIPELTGTPPAATQDVYAMFNERGEIVDLIQTAFGVLPTALPNDDAKYAVSLGIKVPGASDITLPIDRSMFFAGGDVTKDRIATQNSQVSDAKSVQLEGNAAGKIYSFNISAKGEVVGIYTNGEQKVLQTIGLAAFDNPGGLMKLGGNLFQETPNSGTAKYGNPSSGSFGDLTPGALEMSNVDLAAQFTDMITTQRGFQANSRVITTSDEILQELVNLKR
ncbi:flagellar hook protein FlgE [Fusibacter sp. 3D3]|uniref:flagellar hook protein FlgE n=1 Tax=Fusibacter sp. 3D3 TaxID=1048380 RepID=UPI000852A460|nr:flagellar hook protein FlgE [Fusibacter sp. 3D3]GAU79870.1 flagellar hook protein FlgE [Fusibacter sp. 3D3]